MRKIQFSQIAVFSVMLTIILSMAIGTTAALMGNLKLGDFRGIVLVGTGVVMLYAYALIVFRLFLRVTPLREGIIEKGSQQEFVYHVYLLFYLILFHPIIRSGATPVPLLRPLYKALGARMGKNSYTSGIILDPHFVELGDNTLTGQNSLLVPHAVENDRLAHYRIRIGDNVTVGAHAVVLAGVTIDDGAMVASGAIVKKGTHIRAGEVWGGVPAQRLRNREESTGNY